MKSREEYLENLKEMQPTIYCLGTKVENLLEHPVIKPAIAAMAETYALASHPEYKDPLVAISHLSSEGINRYNHICVSREDLLKRVRAARVFQNNVCSCAYRCAGCAAINGLYSATQEMDAQLGTTYHQRFKEYLRWVQHNDLALACGITDVKGDRSLRPSQQADPDLFVRVVERRGDGIIVRGAKAHQSGAPLAHEVIVLPTIRMQEADKDYAMAFALPQGAKGITHIYQHNLYDSRRLVAEDIDLGNAQFGFGYGTSLMILENVFIPWERVFMCGEYAYTGLLIECVQRNMRMVSGACRASQGDLLLGAAATLAEYNGVQNSPHIRDKLTQMSLLIEKAYGCALAAAVEGSPTASGAWCPDSMLANVALLVSKDAFYEIAKLAADIAGGLAVTLPSEKDLSHPVTGPLMQKYLKGRADIPVEHRVRMFRFIENMAASPLPAALLHGAGAPYTQMKAIEGATDFEYKKKLAKRLAGIEG